MAMDIARPDLKRKRRNRGIAYAVAIIIVMLGVTAALSRLRPAAPSVDKSTIYTDTVKRGPMLRDVHGLGTLVPENIRVIPAATDGRVEQRLLLPGSVVKAGTTILVLSNPVLEQDAQNADFEVKNAQAEYNNLKAKLENQLADDRAKAGQVRSDYRQAQIEQETNQKLFDLGLTADVILKTSKVKAEEFGKQSKLTQDEVDTFASSISEQMAVQQNKIEEAEALAALKRSQVEKLRVQAGIEGVLQEVPVEVGQQVAPGTVLARVAQPTELKVELKIAETQAKDILIGQKASIDTHNGVIAGHVTRIDPSVQNGTVTVDCALDGLLPVGARPDLSVEGTIEIERLANVLYVGRPVHGEQESSVSLFKLSADGTEAVRLPVKLGRASVNTIEILTGLQVGDRVVLSDMSAWDNYDRIRLN
jgi:multidrug efflux pump subunit AcrA (membrane-fusion protein)